MANDIVSVQDLANYLDIDLAEVNVDRADLILDLTVEHAQQFVSPVPGAARGLLLRVAARTFANPTGNSYQTVGPNNQGWNNPNVYMDKTEIAELRRLATSAGTSRGRAFQVDLAFRGDYDYPNGEIFGGGYLPYASN